MSHMTLRAYQGDAKTLLAFDLPKAGTRDLAGFTIQCRPGNHRAYYLRNSLRFKDPGHHAQDSTEPANSSVNAPIHKFRWMHVPGSSHQGLEPYSGKYTYTVTPRYFDANASMKPLDPDQSATIDVDVVPFRTKGLELAFTRGYVQSQAFVGHFGPKALIRPYGYELLYDTSDVSGKSSAGDPFTYLNEYEWLGYTARRKIFEILDEVLGDEDLRLDLFAYDLNEPDLIGILLKLAEQGRVRVILDNADLHHSSHPGPPFRNAEDEFEWRFKGAAPGADKNILRGQFSRYSHDKIMVVSDKGGNPVKVLTGSTNFSVTGLYVNSNHVLVFSDPDVVSTYAELFRIVWEGKVRRDSFLASDLADKPFLFDSAQTPPTTISFAPHSSTFARTTLENLVKRIEAEGENGAGGSVLFAVMQLDGDKSLLDGDDNPVYTALVNLHDNESIFSFGIADTTEGLRLYKPAEKEGVLVSGKPTNTKLPRPFNQVPSVGRGHQVHHKFVVCGFNGHDPVVYCGSSNLSLGGEQQNGDNLLEIHDRDVATAFAIEALGLVDHFQFLDRYADETKRTTTPPATSQLEAAEQAEWFLSTTGEWATAYYDPNDLHYVDRRLFA
jgi:phosphatidylserine/phosphatidylglycerophosphate/cardiolipin synthase-like enzyme